MISNDHTNHAIQEHFNQSRAELLAVLNLIPYFDHHLHYEKREDIQEVTLNRVVEDYALVLAAQVLSDERWQARKDASKKHASLCAKSA